MRQFKFECQVCLEIKKEPNYWIDGEPICRTCKLGGYDADGFDENGFDQDGYDQDGYDRDGYDGNGYDDNGYDDNGFDRDGYGYRYNGHQNGYNGDGYQDDDYDAHNDYNRYSDDDDRFSEKNYGIEHGHHVDMENRGWTDDFIAILGPDANTQHPLQYDAMITSLFGHHFELELEATYGSSESAPRNIRTFWESLYNLVRNIELIRDDLLGNDPATALGRVERAVALINFQIGHDRLRQGFWEACNLARAQVMADSALHRTEPVELFRRAFDRYMALHAPIHFWNVLSDKAWRDRHRALYVRGVDAFNSERSARRAAALASEGAENEMLQHNRRNYEDESVFS